MTARIERILRLPEVLQRTGLGRSTVYEAMGEGKFPKKIQLGTRAVGWLESDIDQWVAQKIAESRVPGEGVQP